MGGRYRIGEHLGDLVRTHGVGTMRQAAPSSVEAADEAGIRTAFAAHAGELFGFARRSLGDSSLAEEAVQETFLRAWRARERFDSSLGGMRAWLFAIERRIVIDLARGRARRETAPLPDDISTIDDGLDAVLATWQAEEAVRRLRSEHRAVVTEIYFRGRTSREAAEILGIPEGTVRSRLFYALQALRLILDEMGWDG
ncbi:MAG: sigma-70 family RNA polymerase sigma factor [Acidimicrobiales bacterium]